MRKPRRAKQPTPRAKKTPKTVYLDPKVARAISVFAAMNGKSFSDVMAELAIRRLQEDEKHIRLIKERKKDRVRSYDEFVKEDSAGMASYSIVISEGAEKDIVTVPFPFRRQINQRIFKLKTDPRPPAAEFVLEGEHYRLLVAGWWVAYHLDDSERIVTLLFIVRAET